MAAKVEVIRVNVVEERVVEDGQVKVKPAEVEGTMRM